MGRITSCKSINSEPTDSTRQVYKILDTLLNFWISNSTHITTDICHKAPNLPISSPPFSVTSTAAQSKFLILLIYSHHCRTMKIYLDLYGIQCFYDAQTTELHQPNDKIYSREICLNRGETRQFCMSIHFEITLIFSHHIMEHHVTLTVVVESHRLSSLSAVSARFINSQYLNTPLLVLNFASR